MYIDLLTKIKNAQASGKKTIKTKFIKADQAVLEALERAGFIKAVEVKGRGFKKVMDIEFNESKPIRGLKFLSRPSLRRYAGYKDIRKVKGGHGFAVLSTPVGIISGDDAKKKKVGGQLLFEIW